MLRRSHKGIQFKGIEPGGRGLRKFEPFSYLLILLWAKNEVTRYSRYSCYQPIIVIYLQDVNL